MKQHYLCLCIAAALSAAPATAATLEERLAAADPAAFETIVRLGYGAVEKYAKNGGHDLSLTVSSVRTFSVAEATARGFVYRDIASEPSGWGLDVKRERYQDSLVGLLSLRFHPRWERRASATNYASTTLATFLESVAADRPETRGRVQHVTTYRVVARSQERSRSYRAAFLWVGDVKDGRLENPSLLAIDPIVPAVEKALLADIPPAGRLVDSPAVAAETGTAVCTAGSTTIYGPYISKQDFKRHAGSNSYHYAGYAGKTSCSCDASCRSTCVGTSANLDNCGDQGITSGGFHVVDSESGVGTSSIPSATTVGATCASAFVCGVKSCTFPTCAFSVGVSVNGANATFTPTAGTVWAFKETATATCDACAAAPASGNNGGSGSGGVDYQDPSIPGGGGGGGGGGNWMGGARTCTLVWVTDDLGNVLASEYRCW